MGVLSAPDHTGFRTRSGTHTPLGHRADAGGLTGPVALVRARTAAPFGQVVDDRSGHDRDPPHSGPVTPAFLLHPGHHPVDGRKPVGRPSREENGVDFGNGVRRIEGRELSRAGGHPVDVDHPSEGPQNHRAPRTAALHLGMSDRDPRHIGEGVQRPSVARTSNHASRSRRSEGSMLPPLTITPTRRPFRPRSSDLSAASGAAPENSTTSL
jgi:hypothetical protein